MNEYRKQKGKSVEHCVRLKVTTKDIRKRATSTELSARVAHGATPNATMQQNDDKKIDSKRRRRRSRKNREVMRSTSKCLNQHFSPIRQDEQDNGRFKTK